MRTVSGWHGKRKSSTTRLIRSMPLMPLHVAYGRISWLSLKAKKDKRSLKHGNVSRTRSAWNRKISYRPHKKNSVRVSDKTLAEFFRYGGLSCSALGRSPPPSAVFKIIVVEGEKKSEPISNLENLVRIILVWCGRWDLNPYVIQHTPLKRACLPIPALPHIHFLHQRCNVYIIRNPPEFVNPFFEKSFLRRFSKDAKAAFTPPSLGLFVLLFVLGLLFFGI